MKILTALLLIFSFSAAAESFREELFKKLRKKHIIIRYSDAKKHLFGDLHLQHDDLWGYFIQDVYCEQIISNYDGVPVGPMINPNTTKLNCEHTWPKKYFNPRQSSKMQESDLHHLFPVNSYANSQRGHLPFGEVIGTPVASDCTSSKMEKFFEPPDAHKGNVARAMFYFAVRYQLPIDEVQESFLRSWHTLDPVDHQELTHTQKILEIQGNSNPFVTNPEFVDLIEDF